MCSSRSQHILKREKHKPAPLYSSLLTFWGLSLVYSGLCAFRACWLVWCCWQFLVCFCPILYLPCCLLADSVFIPLSRCDNGHFPKWLRLPNMLANKLSWEANRAFRRANELFWKANSSIFFGSGGPVFGSHTWECCENVEKVW